MQILIIDDGDGDIMASLVVNDDDVQHTTEMIREYCPDDWGMTWLVIETVDDFLSWVKGDLK